MVRAAHIWPLLAVRARRPMPRWGWIHRVGRHLSRAEGTRLRPPTVLSPIADDIAGASGGVPGEQGPHVLRHGTPRHRRALGDRLPGRDQLHGLQRPRVAPDGSQRGSPQHGEALPRRTAGALTGVDGAQRPGGACLLGVGRSGPLHEAARRAPPGVGRHHAGALPHARLAPLRGSGLRLGGGAGGAEAAAAPARGGEAAPALGRCQ
mmetsp:Transcript_77584/g.217509  ORF Transcript_77584/g.217509 Transcript_77584/m.217509 type:complete len:207 (-) Transcript_77584:399-1019(-)